MKGIIIGMIANLKSVIGYLERHLNTYLNIYLYNVYVRLPLTEEKWELELPGFIMKLWIPMHWGLLELVGNNIFLNNIDWFNFWSKIFLMKENISLLDDFVKPVSPSWQFSLSTRRRANFSSLSGVQIFFPLLFFTFDIF